MGRKKRLELEVVNPNAAGVDIGSKSHYVSVGQGEKEVKEFGVYAKDLSTGQKAE